MNHQHGSQSPPPLPALQNLSISPYPPSAANGGDYRYNGVFGPPNPGVMPGTGWGSPGKRGSRSGLPASWYDPPSSRESPNPPYEYRRDASSPPALSPPSSTTSGPTTSSSIPYAAYAQPMPQPYPVDPSFASMAVTPSPPPPSQMTQMPMLPPQMGYLPPSGSAPSLPAPYPPVGMPTYGSQSMQMPPRSNGLWTSHNGYGLPMPEDDVIPTAIVIKNIPFAVPREQLLGVMESLGAPLPYAFNYHHDNGVFRGLAFANFRAPEEAAAVVAALNGYDVQGRKLRVEYKKVLQPGEKDKIEREKALKRMRSIQFDTGTKEMPPPLSIPNHRGGINGRLSAEIDHSPPPSATSSGNSSDLPVSLDLNDPTALDIYSRILVFKEDRMRDELAFSRSLNPTERRIVHLVAQKLGLMSITRGSDGETKYVVVMRDGVSRPALASSSSATVTSSAYLSPYSNSTETLSPSLRIKKSMPDLRGFNGPVVARDPARSLTPQRSSGNLRGDKEYVSMGAAGGRRVNHNGQGLGSGTFNSFFGSPIDAIPPVPPIPSGFTSSGSNHGSPLLANGPTQGHYPKSSLGGLSQNGGGGGMMYGSSIGSGGSPDLQDLSAAPLRNPRGPAGEGRGFGGGGGGVTGGHGASGGGLRNSVSGILKPSPVGVNGLGAIGSKRMYEDLGDQDQMGQDEVERPRTRESLEL